MTPRPLRLAPLLAAAIPVLAHAEAGADLGGSLLQMLLGLGVVLLLVVGSLYLLKRIAAPRGAAAGLLRVVAATAVGTRERVVVVELGETWLVLGVAPGRVTALSQLPRQELSGAVPPDVPGGDFASWLKKVMDKRNAR